MLTDPKLRSQVDSLWDKFWIEGACLLSEPLLDMLGADAVERWFTEKEVGEIITFAGKLSI
jgi:hypothetical protein